MFLDTLILSSIQGGALVLGLYVATRLFPTVPPKVRLWLWRLVFLKLVVGLVPMTSITLKLLASSPETIVPQITPVAESFVQAAGSYAPVVQIAQRQEPVRFDPWLAFYGIGVLAFGSVALRKGLRFRAVIRSSNQVTDLALLSELKKLSTLAGRAVSPSLLESVAVPTAVVTGLMKPTILVPTGTVADEDASLILAHEIAHLRHRDLEWSGLVLAVQAIFFFHPLVWLASRCYRGAQESAADQTAIVLTKTSPRRYAEMLVRATVVTRANYLAASAGMSMAGSTASMKQRLIDMRHYNTKLTLAKISLAVLLSGSCLAMVPGYRIGQSDAKPQSLHASAVPSHKKTQTHRKSTRRSKSKQSSIVRSSKQSGLKIALWRAPVSMTQGAKASQQTVVSIDNLPAREAFKRLYQIYGRSLSVAPDVVGSVTLYGRNLTFDQALKNMVEQVHASYRVVSGIVEISGQMRFPTRMRAFPDQHDGPLSFSCFASDVREALRDLFKMRSFSYVIDPRVQGVVTINCKNVTFDTALLNIVRQVDASYSTDGGLYKITKDSAKEEAAQGNLASGPRELMHVRMEQADVREAIQRICATAKVNVSIRPSVQGTVTLDLTNVTFETALINIVRQVNATYSVESGIYTVYSNDEHRPGVHKG